MHADIIGLFRADITPIDRLLQTTVGRKEMLEDLISKLRANAGKKGGQHFVFIGPRGIGKTHFLSLIEHGVHTDEKLSACYTAIRFPEENNRILSFADFLLCIIRNLAEIGSDPQWQQLNDKYAVLEDDQLIIDAIIPRLKFYRKQSGKIILLLLENMDSLLTQQFKNKQDIHRLRTFLMDSPCATLIGTAPVFFSELYNVKSPLYDFFDIQVLEDLSEELTIELIQQNLEWEKQEALLEDFSTLIPKIRTIHTMTGGNPRLIMMLYELVAHDTILEVSNQFQKLLDQISPFYQDRLKDLAPQERALLETMALMRSEPKTPAAIALRLRKSPQQISSLLQRMTQAGYLTVAGNPADKRSRFYRIKEGFFDLWLAMSESRIHKTRLPYLVEFFRVYYQDRDEREKKREALLKIGESPEYKEREKENARKMLDYLSDIGNNSERFDAKMQLAEKSIAEADNHAALDYLQEMEPITSMKPVLQWVIQECGKKPGEETGIDINKWLADLIEYWKTQRSGELEKAAEIAQRLGYDLSDRGLHEIRIELLKDALGRAVEPAQKCKLLFAISSCQQILGQFQNALSSLQNAELPCLESGNKNTLQRIYNDQAHILHILGRYRETIDLLKKNEDICIELGTPGGRAVSLANQAFSYHKLGNLSAAHRCANKALKIAGKAGYNPLAGQIEDIIHRLE